MDQGTSPTKRRLKVDLDGLMVAFEDASPEVTWYLDVETGETSSIGRDVWRELEEVYEEIGPEEATDDASFAAALARRDLQPWLEEAVEEAYRVEAGFGTRYLRVPEGDSRAGYRDMEEFIATIQDSRLQDPLDRAIQGRGAFRRFKDVLGDYPHERERWFQFRDARLRRRVLEWLEDEGIEAIE